MIMVRLFVAFLKISLFAFGGAYSFLPLVEREVVQNHHWLDKSEFLDVVGMAKVLPGALSIKFATYTGYKIAGITGAVVTNVANLLPPVLLIIFASVLYSKYKNIAFVKAGLETVQYAVSAMIIVVAIRLVDTQHIFQLKHILVIALSSGLFLYTKVHPAFIIIAAGIFGAILR